MLLFTGVGLREHGCGLGVFVCARRCLFVCLCSEIFVCLFVFEYVCLYLENFGFNSDMFVLVG